MKIYYILTALLTLGPSPPLKTENNPQIQLFVNMQIPSHLKMYEQQLTDNATKFLFDDKNLSIADFYLFSLLHSLQDWKPDLLEKFPKVAEFFENLLKDEKIKNRYDEEKQIPWISAGNFAAFFSGVMGKEIKVGEVGGMYSWGYDMDHMGPAF